MQPTPSVNYRQISSFPALKQSHLILHSPKLVRKYRAIRLNESQQTYCYQCLQQKKSFYAKCFTGKSKKTVHKICSESCFKAYFERLTKCKIIFSKR